MIPLCPVCGYSLRGLPEDHQCPECGLCYDAASEIYSHVTPWALWVAIVAPSGTVLALFTLLGARDKWGPFSWMSLFCVCAALVLLVLLLVRTGIMIKRGALVAVMPDGLFLRLDRPEGAWIRWDSISRASVLPKLRVAALFVKEARVVRSVGGVFKTHDDARRFVDQVNERVNRGLGPIAGGGAEPN